MQRCKVDLSSSTKFKSDWLTSTQTLVGVSLNKRSMATLQNKVLLGGQTLAYSKACITPLHTNFSRAVQSYQICSIVSDTNARPGTMGFEDSRNRNPVQKAHTIISSLLHARRSDPLALLSLLHYMLLLTVKKHYETTPTIMVQQLESRKMQTWEDIVLSSIKWV
jgi:hypothetical protein